MTSIKLNNNNYTQWAQSIEVFLLVKEKLQYLVSYPKYDWRVNDAQIYSFLWNSMETQISSTLIFSQVIYLILWKKYQSYTPFSNFLYGNKRLSLMFQIAFFNQIMPMNCFIHHGINLFIIMAKFISHPVHVLDKIIA